MSKQRFEAEETLQQLETRSHGLEDDAPESDDTVFVDGQVVEAEPKKKRNPKVFLAVGGVAFAALVGVIGMQVMKGLAPPPPTPEEIAMQAPPPQPVVVETPVGLMPSARVASGVSAPAGMMDPPVSAAPAVPPAAAAALVPSIDAPPAPPVAAAPVAAVVAATKPAAAALPESTQATAVAGKGASDAELRRIDRRIDDLSRSLEALKAERQGREARMASSSTGPSAVASAPKPKKTAGGETKVARSGGKLPKDPKAAKQPEVAVEAPSTAPLDGLSLRAVYPPAGNDMQAWVLEGESVRVVSRGSVVGGARVIEVKSGLVVTDRGVIR